MFECIKKIWNNFQKAELKQSLPLDTFNNSTDQSVIEKEDKEFIELADKAYKDHVMTEPTAVCTPEFLNAEVAKEALKWIGVTEKGGDNKGPEVERFQKAVDGKAVGEPWCMSFIQFIIKEIEERYGVKSRIFKTEHVLTCWNKTPKNMRVGKPCPGDVICWNFTGTTSGHGGFIETMMVNRCMVKTIEGNTSGPGSRIVREGDGVYLKTRHLTSGKKFRILGLIRPF